jgi:hypothetical protein
VLPPSRETNGMYSLHHIASHLTKNMISVFTAMRIPNLIFTTKFKQKLHQCLSPQDRNTFYTVTPADA